MKGTIEFHDNRYCVVIYNAVIKCYPIYNSQLEYLIGEEVDVEIIDEFTHPELYEGVGWGDGEKMVRIL